MFFSDATSFCDVMTSFDMMLYYCWFIVAAKSRNKEVQIFRLVYGVLMIIRWQSAGNLVDVMTQHIDINISVMTSCFVLH